MVILQDLAFLCTGQAGALNRADVGESTLLRLSAGGGTAHPPFRDAALLLV